MITCVNLTVQTTSGNSILRDVSWEFAPSTFHVVCGPNGSGKTTLLRTLCGLDPRATGDVRFDSKPLSALSDLARAKTFAWVPAEQPLSFGYTVREVVAWGRWSSHHGVPSKQDLVHVDAAIDAMNIRSFMDRPTTELSLGEQKRVHLARAIAADTPYLILDEPCGPLDPQMMLDIMDWIRTATKQRGKTIIASLHDLSLVLNFADTVLILKNGETFKHGQTREILIEQNVRDAFGVKMHQTPTEGGTMILLTRLN